MNALIKQHGQWLNDESLRTSVMCEAEAIVNGRPLTHNALLTGKSKLHGSTALKGNSRKKTCIVGDRVRQHIQRVLDSLEEVSF